MLPALGSDPAAMEKALSEFNHHIAGYVLIVAAMVILASVIWPTMQKARFIWPSLLIALGIFLAAWSDAEIWPRGTLSWTWLIYHDAEARQHKIYAGLLIAIGLLEILRARGKLRSFMQRWALPLMAIFGASLLTMHAHSGTSGLSEIRKQTPGAVLAPSTATTEVNPEEHGHHHSYAKSTETVSPLHHEHAVSTTMRNVQRQHFWMTLVGLVFAISKFVADGERSRWSQSMQFVWPSAMACLGALLVLYRE